LNLVDCLLLVLYWATSTFQ